MAYHCDVFVHSRISSELRYILRPKCWYLAHLYTSIGFCFLDIVIKTILCETKITRDLVSTFLIYLSLILSFDITEKQQNKPKDCVDVKGSVYLMDVVGRDFSSLVSLR